MSKKLEFYCVKAKEQCPKCNSLAIGHKNHTRFSSGDFKCCICLECDHEW